jgi:hypothetical protein
MKVIKPSFFLLLKGPNMFLITKADNVKERKATSLTSISFCYDFNRFLDRQQTRCKLEKCHFNLLFYLQYPSWWLRFFKLNHLTLCCMLRRISLCISAIYSKGKHVAQPLIPDLCSERTHFDSTNLQATLKKINFIAFLSLTRRLLSQEHFLKKITHH